MYPKRVCSHASINGIKPKLEQDRMMTNEQYCSIVRSVLRQFTSPKQ